MAIQARAYANKAGKAEGRNNRVTLSMALEDAVALHRGKSSAQEELVEALGEVEEVANAKVAKKKRAKA